MVIQAFKFRIYYIYYQIEPAKDSFEHLSIAKSTKTGLIQVPRTCSFKLFTYKIASIQYFYVAQQRQLVTTLFRRIN